MSAVFHSKCQAPAFKKALLLNNMQRSAVFHPNRGALPFKIKTTNYNRTFKIETI